MRLVVRHATFYTYPAGTTRAAMLLKLMPRSFDGHRVLEWTVTVNAVPVGGFAPNGHGDGEALWTSHDYMERAEIVAAGVVETEPRAGIVRGLDERMNPAVYLRATPLTEVTPAIAALAAEAGGDDMLDRLHRLSAAVRAAVEYRGGATDAATSAGEALTLGRGVCQDHAHIFIAAARSLGVPARYVTGYLLAADDGLALHETHAWAEARVPGLGWVGFDVSNQVSTTEYHVRLAAGLDAHDAAPVRGTAVAAGRIGIDADVRITPVEAGAPVQPLQEQQQQ